MSSDALVVEDTASLEEVSQRLIDGDIHYLKQHFIVAKQGQYLGLGSTRSLLQFITDQKVESARYANPLTLLPGNVPIQKTLESCLESSLPFSLLYFDINHFKPLNDVLGYRKGDQIIMLLADLLKSHFVGASDFVGHIGGDDFVVITPESNPLPLAKLTQEQFALQARRFYPEALLSAGHLHAQDRDGTQTNFPLAALAVGIVPVSPYDQRTASQLAESASLAKKRAKASSGHSYTLLMDTPKQAHGA